MIEVKILSTPLDVNNCISKVRDEGAGAISSFIGSVRNNTKNKKVIRLEYECRESMALKEMQKIADEISVKYDLIHVCIHHRIGILHPGEDAVIITVSGKHRKESNAASSDIIEMLKKTVPIWKREFFEDGGEWVSNTP